MTVSVAIKQKTAEELRIEQLNLDAHDRVMALGADDIIKKIAELDDLHFDTVDGVVMISSPLDKPARPFNPLKNDVDAFWVMSHFCVLKDYEHYNCIGENFYLGRAKNPIRFWQHDDEGLLGDENTHPIHLAICRAVLLGKHPEFTAHLNQ